MVPKRDALETGALFRFVVRVVWSMLVKDFVSVGSFLAIKNAVDIDCKTHSLAEDNSVALQASSFAVFYAGDSSTACVSGSKIH